LREQEYPTGWRRQGLPKGERRKGFRAGTTIWRTTITFCWRR